MKLNLKFVLIGLSILLFSCKESDTVEITQSDTGELTVDTTFFEQKIEQELIDSTLTIDLDLLLTKVDSDTAYHVPFHLDSIYMSTFEDLDASTLTNAEVEYLSTNLVDNTPTNWSSYSIQSFIDIDSMRLMGTYENYVDNLDIGMMKESDANIHQKIIIDENNYILLWSITYSTYEACPYASGIVVFGTYFYNNLALNTATLGENSGGGDAPYWGSTFITSQINSTLIITNKHEESGGEIDEETGEDIIEISDKEFKVNLTELGFKEEK
jgi:hypothetical protein